MKSKEEIEQLAKKQKGCSKEYCDSIDEQYGYLNGYIDGYTQCQEDMADTMYDLLAWYMSDKGEQYRNETLFVNVIKDYFNSLNKQD